nr:hypothetical protein [Bradyrhizobium sp. 40]
MRHGARPCRSRCAGEPADDRARAPDRLCQLHRPVRICDGAAFARKDRCRGGRSARRAAEFPALIETAIKIAIIDRLSDLGLPVIEVSSFAHPRIVPHLRDAEEVIERVKRRRGTIYRALVPNARGAERAAKAKVDEMLGLITISPTYTRKNQNMSIDEAIAQNLDSFRIAETNGIAFVMALGMSFWCAYEGLIPEDNVIAVVRRLHDGGIRRFYLAGSLGMEDPAHVNRLFRRLGELFPQAALWIPCPQSLGYGDGQHPGCARCRRDVAGRRDLRHRRRHRYADNARICRQLSDRGSRQHAGRDGYQDRSRPGMYDHAVAGDRSAA